MCECSGSARNEMRTGTILALGWPAPTGNTYEHSLFPTFISEDFLFSLVPLPPVSVLPYYIAYADKQAIDQTGELPFTLLPEQTNGADSNLCLFLFGLFLFSSFCSLGENIVV